MRAISCMYHFNLLQMVLHWLLSCGSIIYFMRLIVNARNKFSPKRQCMLFNLYYNLILLKQSKKALQTNTKKISSFKAFLV
jgi:hypothetical protein